MLGMEWWWPVTEVSVGMVVQPQGQLYNGTSPRDLAWNQGVQSLTMCAEAPHLARGLKGLKIERLIM